MKLQKKYFIFLLLTLVLVSVVRFLPAMAEESVDFIEELKLFSRAIGAVMEGYVTPMQPRKLLYSAVNGMLTSLDSHSELIDPERFKLLTIDMKGEYSGIGAALEIVDKLPVIKKIQPKSAAEQVGLKLEDRILKVDGKETLGKDVPEVAGWLRGEENTNIVLSILRPPAKKPFDVTIVRKKILIEAVNDIRIVGKAIGYVRIDNWQDHTAEQFDKAYLQLEKDGMKALVIDLRNNGGGVMTSALGLAEFFLPKGDKILSVNSRIEVQTKDYFSSGEKTIVKVPVIILVNEQSASASEIFSGAMQDHKKATLVGTKTYGKASVQSVVPLDEVSAMKLTTARYLTPNGRMIDGIGITPDYEVKNKPPGDPEADQQIRKALELFKKFY